MGIADRRRRERTERGNRIVSAAREIAETEGWGAVTVRRLAQAVEYSQPVLYSHFENRDAIVAAVAVEGFKAFAAALREVVHKSAQPGDVPTNIALAYLAFAREQPALYEAMFGLSTSLRFAQDDTPLDLRDAFAALGAAVPPSLNAETITETFWASLHGLAELERTGRIRPNMRLERIKVVVNRLSHAL
jgi:AcrR family transcriptional regulator